MNYNRPIIITLLALLSLCASTLAYGFQESPYPGDVTPTTPKKPNPMIDPPAPPGERLPPIDIPPTKPPSKWVKVRDNIKKIGKPNPYEIGIGIAITGIGALVDYVTNPDNNTPIKTVCFANNNNGERIQGSSPNQVYEKYKNLNPQYNYYKPQETRYDNQYIVIFTDNVGSTMSYMITCSPQAEPEVPQPQPVPVPSPNPSPSPSPETQPQPVPVPSPNPSPSPSPETQPQPVPVPSPNPSPSPSPETQPQPVPPDVAPIGQEPKPFELPEFCDWATVVCDFIDWVRQEPPEPPPPEQVPKANLSDLGLDENELFKQRVNFNGQCPKHELKFTVMGRVIIEPMPMHHFCNLLEQLAPWLLAFSYLSSGFFVIRNL